MYNRNRDGQFAETVVGWLVFYGTRSKKGHTALDTRVRVKVFSAKEKIKKED